MIFNMNNNQAEDSGYVVGTTNKNATSANNNISNKPLEVDGGQVIITKPAIDSKDKYLFEGKEMTPKEILSILNSEHGGISFQEGGKVPIQFYNVGGAITDGAKEEMEKNYVGRDCVVSTHDDWSNDKYIIDKIILDYKTASIFLVLNDGDECDLSRIITQGTFMYIKPFSTANDAMNENLFGKNYFNIIKQYGYKTMLPWQVKRLVFKDDNLEYMVLGREHDGQYFQIELKSNFHNMDRIITYNYPILNLPPDFSTSSEIVYPTQNSPYFNKENLIGNFVLSASMDDDDYWQVFNPDGYVFLYDMPTLSNNAYYDCCNIKEEDGYIYERPLNYDKSRELNENTILQVGSKCKVAFRERMACYKIENVVMNDDTYYDYEVLPKAKKLKLDYTQTIKGEKYAILDIQIIGIKLTTSLQCGAIMFEYNNQNYITTDFMGDMNFLIIKHYETIDEDRRGGLGSNPLEKEIVRKRKKDERDVELYTTLIDTINEDILQLTLMRDIASGQKQKVQIDRKLSDLREQRDKYLLDANTSVELIDKLGNTFEQVRVEEYEPTNQLLSINGQPSELSEKQWYKVRSQNFLNWFGDWQSAFYTGDYTNVSKVVNPRTQEPLVCYHGSRADFMSWRFNDFPAAYFADNRSYSQWFANLTSDGFMYQVFVDIKNPIDVMGMGLDALTLRRISDYLQVEYGIPQSASLPDLPKYEKAGQQAMDEYLDSEFKFWQYIRHINPKLIIYLRDNTFYDGIMMYEDNPQDLINGQPNQTGSYMVFRQEQIKWSSAEHFNTQVNNAGFEKGGKI